MKSCYFAISLLLAMVLPRAAAFPEITGKVLFGYQGWHACPGDLKGTGWTHWSRNGAPTPTNLVVDMYPDLSEFGADELCPVPGFTVGGKQASLYSSRHPKTVDRHFRWMKEYGLDGVLVQRFLTEASGKRSGGDVVLKNAMAGALAHGRAFAMEYDISGANAGTMFDQLKADWTYLVDEMKVTEHPGYLRHEGKPVLAVWGMGIDDGNHSPSDPAAAAAIVRWFRREAGAKYQVAYLGGTPSGWRGNNEDAFANAAWSAVYDSMDIVQPWTVGRYIDSAGADRWLNDKLKGDMARTQARRHAYQPVIFPGFSWKNLNAGPANQIPRRGGTFLWRQAVNARRSGAPMLKIAMFDEVDESTAMYKVAAVRKDAPDQGYWLALDADGQALPSDWYLRVANAVTRMFHNEIQPTDALPIKPGDPISNAIEGAIRDPGAPGAGQAAKGGLLRGDRTGSGIRFSGPGVGAGIRILDPRGRMLRLLRPGETFWDGTDASGNALAAGIYRAMAAGKPGSPASAINLPWTGR